MDIQQILPGVIACAIFALICEGLKYLLPILWEMSKNRLWTIVIKYKQYIDSLTNDKDAQQRLSFELLNFRIHRMGFLLALLISFVNMGLVQNREINIGVAIVAGRLFWFMLTLNVIYLIYIGIPCLFKRFALELAIMHEKYPQD
jgi:hypothetical protein